MENENATFAAELDRYRIAEQRANGAALDAGLKDNTSAEEAIRELAREVEAKQREHERLRSHWTERVEKAQVTLAEQAREIARLREHLDDTLGRNLTYAHELRDAELEAEERTRALDAARESHAEERQRWIEYVEFLARNPHWPDNRFPTPREVVIEGAKRRAALGYARPGDDILATLDGTEGKG